MRDVLCCLPAPSRALSRLPVSPSSSQAPLCSSFPQYFSNPSKIEVLHPPGECQSCSVPSAQPEHPMLSASPAETSRE